MARRPIIGVMGSGRSLSAEQAELAGETGRRIAEQGFVLLTGGGAV